MAADWVMDLVDLGLAFIGNEGIYSWIRASTNPEILVIGDRLFFTGNAPDAQLEIGQ